MKESSEVPNDDVACMKGEEEREEGKGEREIVGDSGKLRVRRGEGNRDREKGEEVERRDFY